MFTTAKHSNTIFRNDFGFSFGSIIFSISICLKYLKHALLSMPRSVRVSVAAEEQESPFAQENIYRIPGTQYAVVGMLINRPIFLSPFFDSTARNRPYRYGWHDNSRTRKPHPPFQSRSSGGVRPLAVAKVTPKMTVNAGKAFLRLR